MSNVRTVQDIYTAFSRGDIPAILETLADDVDWDYGYRVAPNPVPWLQAQRGTAGVARFFESLTELEFHRFVPKAVLEGPGLVVALTDVEATVKETAKPIVEIDEVHIWHFKDEGKVAGFGTVRTPTSTRWPTEVDAWVERAGCRTSSITGRERCAGPEPMHRPAGEGVRETHDALARVAESSGGRAP